MAGLVSTNANTYNLALILVELRDCDGQLFIMKETVSSLALINFTFLCRLIIYLGSKIIRLSKRFQIQPCPTENLISTHYELARTGS